MEVIDFKVYENLAGVRKSNYILNEDKYIAFIKKMSNKFNFEGIEGRERLFHELIQSFYPEIKRKIIDEDFNEIEVMEPNPRYIEPTGAVRAWRDKFMFLRDGIFGERWVFKCQWPKKGQCGMADGEEWDQKLLLKREIILKHLGIKPFIPSVMINISPNWKSNLGLQPKIDILKNMMHKYFHETFWFQSIEYVIERGGDPKTAHVHLHAVLEINMEILKSTRSYIKKNSNVKREIKKFFDAEVATLDALRGHCEGALEAGCSIQIQSLNNPGLIEDKLKYLHEETKPPSHKNVEDERFRGLYFTSKK